MPYLLLAIAAIGVGYLLFFVVYHALPKRLRADHQRQHDDILADARSQAVERRKNEAERLEDEHQLMIEQLDADIKERQEDMKITEEDHISQERSLALEETHLQKLTKEMEAHEQKVSQMRQAHEAKLAEVQDLRSQLKQKLESLANVDAVAVSKSLQTNLIESRQRECQKQLKNLDDELASSHKRLAQRTMTRVMARYAPEFYWPKSINFVELADRQMAEKLLEEGVGLIADLKEKAEIEIEVLNDPSMQMAIVKLAGGAGINREAVRLAFNDLLPKGPSGWGKAATTYDKHRALLEQQAVTLGRQAVREVQLEGIHPEIQRLVGYLNWRTSYRQNQWYHTVEVAKLAGIIASELGVDADAAKRVGLLHDIGKAIDYRIEGSHAVISGDYADRFGERRMICDTVMSHHSDLLVETPLAYVLRSADTLSGARPGARVNLEEGYQTRMSGIEHCVRSFPGIVSLSIMNGAREVHVEVSHKRVQENDMELLSQSIAKKIQEEVAFPGEIKILVSRRFEATAVA
jgi:ribonuclease Y